MVDPEFRLVIATCKAAYERSELPPCNVASIDWSRMMRLAARHRVEALCWQGLGAVRDRVPSAIAGFFLERTASIVEANLRAASKSARLRAILDKGGVPALFLKGQTLAALAYPQPFLKMSWDIDLLVDEAQLEKAFELLRQAGFQPIVPQDATDERLSWWHRRSKESVWSSEAGHLTLDLHHRVADNPLLLPNLGVGSPSRLISVAAGVELPTFGKDELFAYLCVHGASSAWFRLKWLADIAALIHRDPPSEIARLYDRSQRLGAGRAAAQALLLAHQYFGIVLPDDLRAQLRSSPVTRWLARIARDQLHKVVEPTARFLGTASIHYSQPFIRPGWRFKMAEVRRQTRSLIGNA